MLCVGFLQICVPYTLILVLRYIILVYTVYFMCTVRTIYEYSKMALVVPSASMGQAAIAIRMFTQAPPPTPTQCPRV